MVGSGEGRSGVPPRGEQGTCARGSQGHWAGQDTHQAVAKQRPRYCQGPQMKPWVGGWGSRVAGLEDPVGRGQERGFCLRCCGSPWSVQQVSNGSGVALPTSPQRLGRDWQKEGQGPGKGLCLGRRTQRGHTNAGLLQGLGRKESQRQPCSAQAKGKQGSVSADPGAVPSSWPGSQRRHLPRAGGSGTSGAWEDRRPGPHRMEPGPGGSGRGPAALAWPLARPSLGVSCKAPAAAVAFKAHTFPGVGTIHLMLRLRKWETRDIN